MADLMPMLAACREVVAKATDGDLVIIEPYQARRRELCHSLNIVGGEVADPELVDGDGVVQVFNSVELVTSVEEDEANYLPRLFSAHRKALRALAKFTPPGAAAFYATAAEAHESADIEASRRLGVMRSAFNLYYFIDDEN